MNHLYDDVMTVEGADGYDDVEAIDYAKSLQRMINAGQWSLQGSFGRTMMGAIEAGDVLLGFERAHDYYGNLIPARTDVRDGTKGSYGYVLDHHGPAWADALAAVDAPAKTKE